MQDAENRLIAEPAPIGTNRLGGQRCKYAEKSYRYKYDLGHTLCIELLNSCKVRCTEHERERERGRCLLIVTDAACGEEENKRLLPLCFRAIVFLSHIVYFTACGLSWFFPFCGFSTLDPVYCHCSYFQHFVHFVLALTSNIRLWPNELVDPFLTLMCKSYIKCTKEWRI